MKIAILGFGMQGRSAYEYWRQGNNATICDAKETLELPEGASSSLGSGYLANLDRFDLIVRSPSVHPHEIVRANSRGILDKVTSVTNEFFRVCPTKHIIGVTGTKGKGTTSTLVAKMLEAGGKRVHLGGNIGTPPLDLLKSHIQPEDWVVLELANFQLIDLKYSPHIAVCLMVVPEHLDWHADMKEYVAAKQQLFRWQAPEDIAIYFSENKISKKVASAGQARLIPFFTPPGAFVESGFVGIDGQIICHASKLKLLGTHNWQNICAAVTAVWQISKNSEAISSVLTSFGGLEHRLEFVREVNGVKYYDDSFGTTPETAMVALEAFAEPKVMILGGSDKGAEFAELARKVKSSNVRAVVLAGATAPKIKSALARVGFLSVVDGGGNMASIVWSAKQATQGGDVVLLSPACASFGMFKNYRARGEEFKKAVNGLAS